MIMDFVFVKKVDHIISKTGTKWLSLLKKFYVNGMTTSSWNFQKGSFAQKGNRNIKWEITASNHDPHNMTLNESFIIDGKKITKKLAGSFPKVGKKHTFLRGHGLVKIQDNQAEDFEWWKQKRRDGTNGKWPLYMLFSLFARKYIKTNQDSQLAKWQGTIRDIEKNNKKVRVNILRPYQKSGVARINYL